MASVYTRSLGYASRHMSTRALPRMNLAPNATINVQKNGQFTSNQPVGDSPSLRRFSSKKFAQGGVEKNSLETVLSKALKESSLLVKEVQQILNSIGIGNVDQLRTLNRTQLQKLGLQSSVVDAIESFIRPNEVKPTVVLHIDGLIPFSTSTSSTPQASVSDMVYEGFRNPFHSKSNEQFWKDLEDNLQETHWMRSEQALNGQVPLQWFRDWKNLPAKPERPNLRPIMKINSPSLQAGPFASFDFGSAKIISKDASDGMELSDHKSFITNCGTTLGIKQLDDWYHVNILDFKKSNILAPQFLANYQNSLIQALIALMPEHNWKIWKFESPLTSFLNDASIEEQNLEDHENSQEEDWRTTMNRYKDHWQVTSFSTSKGTSLANEAAPFSRAKEILENVGLEKLSGVYDKQQELYSTVKELLPTSKVVINYTNPLLVYSDTKRPFSLNCYLPDHKISFEVIEDPNFSWQYAFGSEIPIYTFNKAKRAVCEKHGIDVIQVPSWWDSKSSLGHLVNAIKRIRPEIKLSTQKSDGDQFKIATQKNTTMGEPEMSESESEKDDLKEEVHHDRV